MEITIALLPGEKIRSVCLSILHETQVGSQSDVYTMKRKHDNDQDSDERRKKQVLGDIYYVTIRAENKNHYAKRNVLVQKSEYFHAMFCSGFVERDKDIIDLPSITSQNLQSIIDFTHTDKISLTEHNALTLLLDADYLGIDDLKRECYQFMCKNVTISNAFHAYRTAELLDYMALKEKAKDVICRAFLVASQRDKYFVDCDVELLKDLLTSTKVQACPPVALFNAIMRWSTWDVEGRMEHLENMLAKVKLALIDEKYLKSYFDGEKVWHENVVDKIMSLHQKNIQLNLQNYTHDTTTRIVVLQASSLKIIEIYDPSTGKWEVIETGDKECRSSYTCAIHNRKLYVFGGKIDGKCTNTAKVYDFDMKCWSSIAPMSTPRQRTASAVLDDYLYVFAGRKDDKTDLNSAERYCPTTNKWEPIASLNERRCDHSAVALEGHLYVSGGVRNRSGKDRSCDWSSQIEKYDPQTNTWINVQVHKPRRRSSFGIAVYNNCIYSCGGTNYGDKLGCSDYYDPNSEKQWWKHTNTLNFSMNQRRANHALVSCEGKLWAIGGSDNTVEIFDPKTDFWIYGPSMNKINGTVVGDVLTI